MKTHFFDEGYEEDEGISYNVDDNDAANDSSDAGISYSNNEEGNSSSNDDDSDAEQPPPLRERIVVEDVSDAATMRTTKTKKMKMRIPHQFQWAEAIVKGGKTSECHTQNLCSCRLRSIC